MSGYHLVWEYVNWWDPAFEYFFSLWVNLYWNPKEKKAKAVMRHYDGVIAITYGEDFEEALQKLRERIHGGESYTNDVYEAIEEAIRRFHLIMGPEEVLRKWALEYTLNFTRSVLNSFGYLSPHTEKLRK